MPFIYEQPASRSFDIDARGASLTLDFWIQDAADEVQAQVLSMALAPVVYRGLVRQKLRVEAVPGGHWVAHWTYGVMDPQQVFEPGGDIGDPVGGVPNPVGPSDSEALGPTWSVEVGAGTARITQSRQTINFSPGAPDTHQAVGLTRDGVEGTDVYVPQVSFQRTVQRETIDPAYVRTSAELVGTVNNAVFYNFHVGTLLYLGWSGSGGTGVRWSLTHKWAFSPNEVLVDVGVEDDLGNPVPIPFKRGWDYVWVSYRDDAPAGANVLLRKPVHWYLERVYRYTTWEALEIGT